MTGADRPAELLTFQSCVPAWEIDVNEHWNTAFYIRAFQQASEAFAHSVPGPRPPAPPEVFHLRFFRELRLLDAFHVGSCRVSPARAPYAALHRLRAGAGGALSASALELRGDGLAPDPQGDEASAVAPHSLEPGRHPLADADALIAAGRATASHVGVLRPEDFDGAGDVLMTALHMRVSDGNSHLWKHVGISSDAFYGRGLGRAIVELKITRQGKAVPGMAVRQVSWFTGVTGKSIKMCHQLEDLVTGAAISSISTVTLVIDLEKRKATEVPSDIAGALLGSWSSG